MELDLRAVVLQPATRAQVLVTQDPLLIQYPVTHQSTPHGRTARKSVDRLQRLQRQLRRQIQSPHGGQGGEVDEVADVLEEEGGEEEGAEGNLGKSNEEYEVII